MQYALGVLALAAAVSAQSCKSTFPGNGGYKTFTFQAVNYTNPTPQLQPVSSEDPVCAPGNVVITLNDGVMVDSDGRTGSVVANHQVQFDGPPQAGVIFTDGWAYCDSNPANVTLTRAGQSTFYVCGDIHNIYDVDIGIGSHCYPVYLQFIPCSSTKTLVPKITGGAIPTGKDSSSSDESSSPSSSSPPSSSTSSSSSSTSEASSSSAAPVTSTPAPVVTPPPSTNATMPAGTGTGSTMLPSTTKPAGKPSPSPFVGAGSVLAAGQKVLGLAAGAAAFALL